MRASVRELLDEGVWTLFCTLTGRSLEVTDDELDATVDVPYAVQLEMLDRPLNGRGR